MKKERRFFYGSFTCPQLLQPLESSLRVERLVDQSAALGYRHVALTDKDAMFATMKFYKYALSKNIHPILGLELDVQMKQGPSTFILLAKNDRGLQDLYALSTQRMQIQNTVTFEELCKRSADCVVISCGIQDHDILNGWILHDDTEKLKEYFITCKNSFLVFMPVLPVMIPVFGELKISN